MTRATGWFPDDGEDTESANIPSYYQGDHDLIVRAPEMVERIAALEAENARLEALFQTVHKCHHGWVSRAEALRELVEEAASALYADRANGDRERWLAKKKEVLG